MPDTREGCMGLDRGVALDFSRSNEISRDLAPLREFTPTLTWGSSPCRTTARLRGSIDSRILLQPPKPLVELLELALDPILKPPPRPREAFRLLEPRRREPPAAEPHPRLASRGEGHRRRPHRAVPHARPFRRASAAVVTPERAHDPRRADAAGVKENAGMSPG